jgi:hypothetical protein
MASGRYHWPSVPVEKGTRMQATQGDWLPARESVVQFARDDVGKCAAGTSPAGIVVRHAAAAVRRE